MDKNYSTETIDMATAESPVASNRVAKIEDLDDLSDELFEELEDHEQQAEEKLRELSHNLTRQLEKKESKLYDECGDLDYKIRCLTIVVVLLMVAMVIVVAMTLTFLSRG